MTHTRIDTATPPPAHPKGAIRPRLSWWLLSILLILTLLIRLGFVFYGTDYANYLFSDCGGYWQRALNHLAGNQTAPEQWAIWPPLPHILLAEWFKLIALFGVDEGGRLSSVMVLNAVLGVIDTALMASLSRRLTGSVVWGLGVAAFFGLGYPYLYFNAFVMSEHPAWTAFLAALWRLSEARPRPIQAGVWLGIATALRPGYGLVALVAGLFLLWRSRHRPWPASWLNAAGFSVAFIALLIWVVANNVYLSQGHLSGLGANGGVNFYLSACRIHRLQTSHDGYTWVLMPPAVVDHPEYGTVQETVPFHRQDHYFGLGLACLRDDGWDLWRQAATLFDDLVFGPLFPAVGSAAGAWLMDAHRPLMLALLLLVPLAPALTPKGYRRDLVWLLLGTLVVMLLTFKLFLAEYRFLYSLAFVVVPLAAVTMQGMLARRLPRPVGIPYAGLLLALLLAMLLAPSPERHPPSVERQEASLEG